MLRSAHPTRRTGTLIGFANRMRKKETVSAFEADLRIQNASDESKKARALAFDGADFESRDRWPLLTIEKNNVRLKKIHQAPKRLEENR